MMKRPALRAALMLSLSFGLVLAGCTAAQIAVPTPSATVDHSAHMADSPQTTAAVGESSAAMATHEALMQDPVARATHEAQMQDPAALATHEALMHGPATPVPVAVGAALTTFATADFAGAGQCVMCHEGLIDTAGTDVSITTHWRSSMMANASRDPAWQAKVASEVIRNPDLADLIEKKCGACHVPMAAEQAEVDGLPVALFDGGLLDPANPLHPAAQDGVSCTLCHQIQPAGLGEQASFSGGYSLDTATEAPDRVTFGPYKNPFARPMQMHTGYVPVYRAHVSSAALCATCHNLYTPFVDAAGQVQGEFPEQTPYTEWQQSAFGQGGVTCQACHMPAAAGGVVISLMPGNLAAREPFSQHHFVGGNAFMVGVLRDHAADLGVSADAAHFYATAERVDTQLGRAAALSVAEAVRDGDTLTARLQINAGTGHKFPTSFPARRAWLHVTVSDGAGKVVFESGQPRADGAIVGNDADAAPGAFEPHYDLVTAADQVQIYEPIMGDTDGNVTYTLLRASRYLKDNRLLPAGADKAVLPSDVAVYGAAADDPNFIGGGDLVTYRVSLAGATGPFTLAAELLYQPLSYRFVQDMLADSTTEGTRFGGYYAAADKAPNRVAAIAPLVVP